MEINCISENPIHEIPYITAASGGVGMIYKNLPILLAEVDVLPSGLEAMIITSDLQGFDPANNRLLGHLVVEELEMLAEKKLIPPSRKTGVILAGDLYAKMNKRGGKGDVREVWRDFNRCFRWVAGVAGNHDDFGTTPREFEEFKTERCIYYLDGDIVKIGDFQIGGISGIIGNKEKPLRRPQQEFTRVIKTLVEKSPDILVLHQGPSVPEANLLGDESVHDELINANRLLVICGHCHWKIPMANLSANVKVINVDSRVVILKSS